MQIDKALFNEDLSKYRAYEMVEGVEVLRLLENETISLDYYKGAMFMLKKIISLPKKLADRKDKDQILLANDLMKASLKAFESLMLHKGLDDQTIAE